MTMTTVRLPVRFWQPLSRHVPPPIQAWITVEEWYTFCRDYDNLVVRKYGRARYHDKGFQGILFGCFVVTVVLIWTMYQSKQQESASPYDYNNNYYDNSSSDNRTSPWIILGPFALFFMFLSVALLFSRPSSRHQATATNHQFVADMELLIMRYNVKYRQRLSFKFQEEHVNERFRGSDGRFIIHTVVNYFIEIVPLMEENNAGTAYTAIADAETATPSNYTTTTAAAAAAAAAAATAMVTAQAIPMENDASQVSRQRLQELDEEYQKKRKALLLLI